MGKKNKALELALWNIAKNRPKHQWRTRYKTGERPISLSKQKEALRKYQQENPSE